MKVVTYEAKVENGQVSLVETVRLPEHATVYVVVPGGEDVPNYRVPAPRLARPEQVPDFTKEVLKEDSDAGL